MHEWARREFNDLDAQSGSRYLAIEAV